MQVKRHIFETTEDWKTFRRGLFTASRINELMAKPKNDKLLSVGAYSYIYDLISEVDAEPKPDIYNASIEWGNSEEPQAVLRYAEKNGLDINSSDFIYTSVGGFVFFCVENMFGGTPDIILKDKICEVKCPDSDTHLYYLNELMELNFQGELPKYYDQMQLNMFLCNRDSCDFISFDSRFKNKNVQMFTLNIKRDDKRIADILEKIQIAHEEKEKIKLKYQK